MNRECIVCLSMILILPFAVGAALEFLPIWVSIPSTIVGLILWFAAASCISHNARDNT